MQISVQGKQLDVGDALRERIEDQITQIAEKYFTDPVSAHATMSKAGHEFKCDLTVHVGKGITVQSQGSSDDAHQAFDSAAQKAEKRLRRYKRRIRDHHRGHDEQLVPVQQYVIAADQSDSDEDTDHNEPMIVAEMEASIDTLTVGEAVMRMDLSDSQALMFRDRKSGRMNMVYRRADGNIGWVDPSDGN